jgi:hypothetical protein
MARRRSEIRELEERLRALPPKDRAEVIRSAMTPAMQLRLAVEKLWSKPGKDDPRGIMTAIRAARRELERKHAAHRAKRDRKRAS